MNSFVPGAAAPSLSLSVSHYFRIFRRNHLKAAKPSTVYYTVLAIINHDHFQADLGFRQVGPGLQSCLKVFRKGPSTYNEECTDEYSTNFLNIKFAKADQHV